MIHSRLLTLLWLLPAAPVFAEDLIKSTDNDIIVYGRAIEQIGVASSASEGTAGFCLSWLRRFPVPNSQVCH